MKTCNSRRTARGGRITEEVAEATDSKSEAVLGTKMQAIASPRGNY